MDLQIQTGESMRLERRLAAWCMVLAGLAPPAQAASDEVQYPTRPVRIITPLGPGSAVDITTRLIAQRLGDAFGQQFIVENRVGAAGTVGAQAASKAPPDGYTLLITTNAPLTTNLALYRNLDYGWQDFEPIMVVAQAPVVLIVNPALGVSSVSDVVALSRRTPGGLSTATTGNGSIGHFVINEMRQKLGANLVNIPYKGGVAGVTAVATGEAPLGILDTGSATPFIKDGRIRALGIAGDRRASAIPDVPTLAELGISGSDIIAWVGFVAPKGTPKAVVQKLSAETSRALQDAQLRQRLVTVGVEPVDGSSPEKFAAFLRDEVLRWQKRVQDLGLRAE
jgi:tripartite-type tricarboxylate transporter receptor subunit TctC